MIIVWSLVALSVGLALGVAFGRARLPASNGPADSTSDESIETRRQREPLGEILDHLDLAVVVSDRDSGVSYRNSTAAAMQGTHVGVLIDGHVDEVIGAAVETGSSQRRVDLHGPPRVSLDLRAQHLHDERAVVIIEDVSERARIEAMRTDFVANISHELKTPVGALAVLADALDGETDLEVIGLVSERLTDESHRAVTTIDDLLELAQIETASSGTDVVDMADLVRTVVKRAAHIDPEVVVEAIESDATVFLRCDARQIASAIGNLVENAVKYSDPGGRVQVRTRVEGGSVEVMVADQGVGIPERDLDRIFERFYRVDRARSRSTGGTGLGLAIVRHVASNHGGHVTVSSQEGDGSTFVMRLPAALRVQVEDADDEAGLSTGIES